MSQSSQPPALLHLQPYRPSAATDSTRPPTPGLPPAPHDAPSNVRSNRNLSPGRREPSVRRRDVLSFEQIVAARQLRQMVHSEPFHPPAPAIRPGQQSRINAGQPLENLPSPSLPDSLSALELYAEPERIATAPSAHKPPNYERTAIRRPAGFDPTSPTPSQRAAMQKPRTKLDKHGRVMNVVY